MSIRLFAVAAGVCWSAAVAVAAGSATPVAPAAQAAGRLSPATSPEAFAARAEALVEKVCIRCHGWERIGATRRPMLDWDRVLGDMVVRGAIASPAEMETIRAYMLWSYGLVAINRAPAGELAAVIGIPSRQATAIVEHRKKAPIANLAALLKVPGIDRKKVSEQADALRFR